MKKLIIMCLMAFIGFGVAEVSAQKKNEGAVKTTVFVTDIDCEHWAKKITNTIMVFDAKQLAATLNTLNNIGYEITNIRTEKY